MFSVGRLCLKLKGRDSNNYAIIVAVINDNYVLVDGNVRRKKCNKKHLEPLEKKFDIKSKASTSDVHKVLEKEGLLKVKKEVKKSKPKKEKSKIEEKIKSVDKKKPKKTKK
jgi:large subunit ribosomal protein L14e